jgi:hypothetical protein
MTAQQASLTPAEYAIAAARAMSEEQLYEACRAILDALRLWHYHTRMSRGSTAGYPDLHIIAPGRGHMFRELKRQDERTTMTQLVVLDMLHDLGLDVSVWRPADLLSGHIRDELLELHRREKRI